jgi:hypothetical protein
VELVGREVAELKLDAFLRVLVMIVDGREHSVSDSLKPSQMCLGRPRGQAGNQTQAALTAVAGSFQLMGEDPLASALRGIARVVLRGLQPLRLAIEAERAEGLPAS